MADSTNVGRRVKVLVRTNIETVFRAWTGVLTAEDAHTWTVLTDRGETVTEAKQYCSVLWDVPKKQRGE